MLAHALELGITPPIVVKERKHAYHKCLETAQTKDNYIPLKLFIAESIEFSGELLRK